MMTGFPIGILRTRLLPPPLFFGGNAKESIWRTSKELGINKTEQLSKTILTRSTLKESLSKLKYVKLKENAIMEKAWGFFEHPPTLPGITRDSLSTSVEFLQSKDNQSLEKTVYFHSQFCQQLFQDTGKASFSQKLRAHGPC